MARIIDMVNRVNQYGTLRPNRFKVEFVGAAIEEASKGYYTTYKQSNGKEQYQNRISLSCKTFSMPGRGISTNEYKTRGLLRKIPYGRIYTNEVSCTLLLGAEMWERKIFERWMDSVVDPLSGKFHYYDSYISDAFVTLYTDKDEPVYKICLKEVYPTNIDNLELDTSSTDGLLEQNVTFAFRTYYPIDISGGEESTTPAGLYNASNSNRDDLKRPMTGTPIKVANEGGVETHRELSEEAEFMNGRCSVYDSFDDLSSYEGDQGGVFNPGF
jgi:hypothetical protein